MSQCKNRAHRARFTLDRPDAGDEVLDLRAEPLRISKPGRVCRARKLDETASRNPLGKVLPRLAGREGVVLAIEHKRGHADRGKQPANVHRRVGACERGLRGAWTRAGLVVGR